MKTFVLAAMLAVSIGVQAEDATKLLAALAGEDETARADARQLLPRNGVSVVDPLLALMKSGDPRVWRAARNVLADIANEACAPGREEDRETAAKAFLAFAEEKDLAAHAQREALRLLGLSAPDDMNLRPMRALATKGTTREETLAALEMIGSEKARDVLESLLREGSPEQRADVIDALTAITPVPEAPVKTRMLRDNEPAVRVAAMRALAQTGSTALVVPFEEAMENTEGALRTDALEAYVRLAEAIAAGGGHAEAARGIYSRILRDETGEGIRGAAVAGLIRMHDEDAAKIARDTVAADTTGALEAAAQMPLDGITVLHQP